jgi:hypothetical protein
MAVFFSYKGVIFFFIREKEGIRGEGNGGGGARSPLPEAPKNRRGLTKKGGKLFVFVFLYYL